MWESDPDCAQLIADLGDPNRNDATFEKLLIWAPMLITRKLFEDLPLPIKLNFACPNTAKTYQFLSATCVQWSIEVGPNNSWIKVTPEYCGQACCIKQINACYNAETQQSEYFTEIVEYDEMPPCGPGCYPICYIP